MPHLHVNIDHVATLRQARRGAHPDPVEWALAVEEAGAHGITCHLRKDRRHIQDADVRNLRARIRTVLNLECSLDPEMVGLALESGAQAVCIVPERREELTTEGGLDVRAEHGRLERVVPLFAQRKALVSLFIDPDPAQVEASADLGVPFVELHTGSYASARGADRQRELERLLGAARLAQKRGLRVNAGHGLDYDNVSAVARIEGVVELNIGFAIVSRALFCGASSAVRDMLLEIGGRP
jgi:pyridoxine 5-phosphate synthase